MLLLHFTATYISLIDILVLGKEGLNSDGNQFHQYQENEQSPLILTELTA